MKEGGKRELWRWRQGERNSRERELWRWRQGGKVGKASEENTEEDRSSAAGECHAPQVPTRSLSSIYLFSLQKTTSGLAHDVVSVLSLSHDSIHVSQVGNHVAHHGLYDT